MKSINKLLIIFTMLIILNACGGLSDAGKVLRNEKTRTTDEFLVKKRDPLILPPDYSKLPAPDTLKQSAKEKDNNIKDILKIPKNQNSNNSKASSIEQLIIEKIGK
tara:strand:+ start:190 stop:507 length:318 start_codon:yes stop_codon:yes gene_type:complete